MGEEQQTQEKTLNNFELGNELYTLVENNIIPAFIADKIKQKVKDANVRLTKRELSEIVDIVKKEIKTHKLSYPERIPPNPSFSDNMPSPPEFETSLDNEDVELGNLFKSIAHLDKRVDKIENVKMDYGEDDIGEMVTTDDIYLPEKYGKTPKNKIVRPLDAIPNDPERVVVLMKWLQFLVDKVGRDNLTDILEYYVDIGWISERIVMNLVEYSEGITEETGHHDLAGTNDLQAKDHIQSLLYIQRLKGLNPDSYFLHRIERKLNKMTRNLTKEKEDRIKI
jgi:archaellum component FlaD/FlaE